MIDKITKKIISSLGEDYNEVKRIGSADSSNRIYLLINKNKRYVLKILKSNLPEISAFWCMMKEVFKFNPYTKLQNLSYIHRILSINANFSIPKPIKLGKNFVLYEYMEGKGISEDVFPQRKLVQKQINSYIIDLHKRSYRDIKFQLNPSDIKKVIIRFWNGNKEVENFYLKNIDNFRYFKSAGSALIMPDMSADQFLYDDGYKNIMSLIDYETYFLGPIELELTLLELILPDYDIFIEKYNRQIKTIDLTTSRRLMLFLIYIMDENQKLSFSEFCKNDVFG